MALPMCICDVAEQTGHERNYRARLEPKRALEAPRTSEVSQSQSRTEEDVCIIKRPLTGSNQPLSSCLFSFSSCFLFRFDYKISSLSISERVQGRSRPHMFLLACLLCRLSVLGFSGLSWCVSRSCHQQRTSAVRDDIFAKETTSAARESRPCSVVGVYEDCFRTLASRSPLFSDLSKQNKIGGRLITIMSLRIEYRCRHSQRKPTSPDADKHGRPARSFALEHSYGTQQSYIT